jgi:hypothetical protein
MLSKGVGHKWTVCYGAAAGTTMPGTAGRRIVTGTTRTTATTTTGSALPALQLPERAGYAGVR